MSFNVVNHSWKIDLNKKVAEQLKITVFLICECGAIDQENSKGFFMYDASKFVDKGWKVINDKIFCLKCLERKN